VRLTEYLAFGELSGLLTDLETDVRAILVFDLRVQSTELHVHLWLCQSLSDEIYRFPGDLPLRRQREFLYGLIRIPKDGFEMLIRHARPLQLSLTSLDQSHEPVYRLHVRLGQMTQCDGEGFRRHPTMKARSVLAVLAREGRSGVHIDREKGTGEARLLGRLADGCVVDGFCNILPALGEAPFVL
jgi:hypothetical protein